jgi:hypothetical protein
MLCHNTEYSEVSLLCLSPFWRLVGPYLQYVPLILYNSLYADLSVIQCFVILFNFSVFTLYFLLFFITHSTFDSPMWSMYTLRILKIYQENQSFVKIVRD